MTSVAVLPLFLHKSAREKSTERCYICMYDSEFVSDSTYTRTHHRPVSRTLGACPLERAPSSSPVST